MTFEEAESAPLFDPWVARAKSCYEAAEHETKMRFVAGMRVIELASSSYCVFMCEFAMRLRCESNFMMDQTGAFSTVSQWPCD
jgi:hypothetical protein